MAERKVQALRRAIRSGCCLLLSVLLQLAEEWISIRGVSSLRLLRATGRVQASRNEHWRRVLPAASVLLQGICRRMDSRGVSEG